MYGRTVNCTRAKVISDFDGHCWQPPAITGELLLRDGSRQRVDRPNANNVQAVHQSAYDEGFRRGRDAGYAAGREQGLAQLADQCAYLGTLISGLADPLQRIDETMTHTLADLAVLIARHLVRRELKTAPGEIVAVVRQALAVMPAAARPPRVRLNPDDVEIVNQALGAPEAERSWRLEADPLIARGGCTVDSETSFVDATVEARISAIALKMLGGDREGDRAP